MSIRTRKEAMEAIKGLVEDITYHEDRIEEAKESIGYAETEIELIRNMIDKLPIEDSTQLERLNTIVQRQGTGHERAIMDTVMSGGNVAKDEIERVKILGIQMLNEKIEEI